jgi:hypothetical protein
VDWFRLDDWGTVEEARQALAAADAKLCVPGVNVEPVGLQTVCKSPVLISRAHDADVSFSLPARQRIGSWLKSRSKPSDYDWSFFAVMCQVNTVISQGEYRHLTLRSVRDHGDAVRVFGMVTDPRRRAASPRTAGLS